MKSIVIVAITVLIPLAFGARLPLPAKNTPENIALLKSGKFLQSIEELGGQYQGDMVLTEDQKRMLLGTDRTGLIDTRYRWPERIVPYTISSVFDAQQLAHIQRGLREIENATCIRFVERTDEVSYVDVTGEPAGCFSYVGHLGSGRQQLNLELYPVEEGCFRIGTIIHEFLHALGFYHMHSATERDDFVRIAWENIQPGTASNFNTYPADRISNFGELYDTGSVLHYNAFSATRNGFATIVPHDISQINVMGQRYGMSDRDIRRINAMYDCANV